MTPAERPQTLTEAFARDAATQTTDPTAQPEAATTAPAAETSQESAKGPIPFEAHKTALENARAKAAEAAKAELLQSVGWAQNLDRTTVEQGLEIGRLYQQDRAGFVRQLLMEASSDPDLAPLVRSEAARVLGQRRQTQPDQAAPDLSPDIPVMDAEGRVVAQTFSSDRVQQIVQQAVQQALDREVAPLKQDYQTRRQQEAARQEQQAIQTYSQDIYSEAADMLPGFKEHEADIAKAFERIPSHVPADKALRLAWKEVVGGKLAPADQVRADTLKDLQTKAAASAVNPASAAIPPTRRPVSLLDPGLSWG